MKLKGHQIIIFGLPRFDSSIESTNYTTARLLARENMVYYVENPFTLKDYFKLRKKAEFKIRKRHFAIWNHAVIDTDVPNLKIIIPPILLSINFLPESKLFRSVLKINEGLIRAKLQSVIKARKIKDYIYINSFNFHYPTLAEGLSPALTVYHCLDPMILPFNRRHGVVSEDILVRESDVVICSSRALYLEKLDYNPKSYFVPNAADVKHSSKALQPNLPVFPAVAKIKGPVIGYLGAIERRIDYAMLQEVITRNTDKSFVFVGPLAKEFVPDWFFSAPNVTFINAIEYADMPAVIKGFDVALIPFKKDEVSSSIFPLKLFEYLGAGKPVVAIDFNPDLKEFTDDMVPFCTNATDFSEAIALALASNDEAVQARRVAIAAENTWEKRVDAIAEIIFENLPAK